MSATRHAVCVTAGSVNFHLLRSEAKQHVRRLDLGIIGGGGIGFLLLSALRVLQEPTVGAIIIVIFVIVYAIELVGSFVRWLVE
jgi:ABC-type phosphate/phosphonate transport system permease subunit